MINIQTENRESLAGSCSQDSWPKIMGILNITPDSFSNDGLWGQSFLLDKVLQKVESFIKTQVDIIDIGGESTRPTDALPISAEEEMERILPVVEAIRQRFKVCLSIDTFKASVAKEALKRGVDMINDVSGLRLDSQMAAVAKEFNVPVVLMHSHISYERRQMDHTASKREGYNRHIVSNVKDDLLKLVQNALDQGIISKNIIIDPGIGFGKSTQENLSLLKNLNAFKELGYPILVGASRKTFIGKLTGLPPQDRLPGSLGVATLALLNGADYIRVHDVAETRQIVQLVQTLKEV